MLHNNQRRPGRTDQQPSHTEPGETFFYPLEELEARTYADASPAPFPSAPLFETTSGTYSIFDGNGGNSGASPLPSEEWDNGHTLMGLTQMWNDPRFASYRGAGMRTVVIDSGINLGSSFFGPDDDHNGIADRIVYQYDYANSDNDASDTMGHGSNVASALASSDSTYGGVAPDADIIALRVFNDAGQGNFSWLERGLQWVVSHAVQYNIASVNMSLGDGSFLTSHASMYGIGDELASLANMGVIVTAAAGNSYYDGGSRLGLSYPAADPNVISVGAVYSQDGGGFGYSGGAIANVSPAGALTPFTQRGPLLDILAPGAPIVGASTGDGLTVMHGTSQASPQIAGLAVLAQQMASDLLGRRLTLNEFRSLIVSTATQVVDGDDEDDNVTNTGATYPLANALGMAEGIWNMRTVAQPVVNTAPVLNSVDELAGAVAGRGAMISYATLARAVHASDADGNALMFQIDSVLSGAMTINGRTVTGQTIVHPGDAIVWTPDSQSHGATEAFNLRAFDGVASSDDSAAVSINVGDRCDPAYARGIRLASDAPLSSTAPGTNSATVEQLPTVRGLNFLEFTSNAHASSASPLNASALFAGVSMRIAA